MARSKEGTREVEKALRELMRVHPLMTLKELDALVSDVIVYRNRAIIYKDDVIKRITVKPNEDKHSVPDIADGSEHIDNTDDCSDY